MDGDLPLSILSLNYEQIGANFSTGFLDGHFYFGVTPEFRIRVFMLNKFHNLSMRCVNPNLSLCRQAQLPTVVDH